MILLFPENTFIKYFIKKQSFISKNCSVYAYNKKIIEINQIELSWWI